MRNLMTWKYLFSWISILNTIGFPQSPPLATPRFGGRHTFSLLKMSLFITNFAASNLIFCAEKSFCWPVWPLVTLFPSNVNNCFRWALFKRCFIVVLVFLFHSGSSTLLVFFFFFFSLFVCLYLLWVIF